MPEQANRQDTLEALATALTHMAQRMRVRESAAKDFKQLMARAEAIAAKARLLQTSKWGVADAAASLVGELDRFAKDVAVAATRATAEVSGNTAISDALLSHAHRVGQIARLAAPGSGSTDIAAELRPLEATLTALHGRMLQEGAVSNAADRLALRAAGLAQGALALRSGGRAADAAATEIHAALRGFADQAGDIASRMTEASTGLREAAAGIALRTQALSAKPAAKALVW